MDDNNNNKTSLVKVVFWAGRFTSLLSPSQEKAWRIFSNQIRLGFVGSSFYLGVWTWQFWTKYSCGRYASVWGMTLSNWNILVPIAFLFTALKAYRTYRYHYFYLLALLTQSSVDYMLLAIGCVILQLQMNKHIFLLFSGGQKFTQHCERFNYSRFSVGYEGGTSLWWA